MNNSNGIEKNLKSDSKIFSNKIFYATLLSAILAFSTKENNLYAQEIQTLNNSISDFNSINNIDKNNINLNHSEKNIEYLYKSCTLKDCEDSTSKSFQDKRYNRYKGNDAQRDSLHHGELNRQRLIDGYMRMLRQGHVWMITEKAEKNNVPIDIVFLALAESYREAHASSGVAGGYRQFTKPTASMPTFKLYKSGSYDYRGDAEKSTDAAIKHLLLNKNIIENRKENNKFTMTANDIWKFSMLLYNGSQKLIYPYFVLSEGNIDRYIELQTNRESKNYIPRVLAIRQYLYSTHFCTPEEEFQNGKIELEQKIKNYITTKDTITDQEKNQILIALKNEYSNLYSQYPNDIISKNKIDCLLEELQSMEILSK